MDKMYTGEWTGTMCLTEPQAGSDVGALRTKAARRPDGSYSISGNKIFISAGDHDLTENIIHMVLARIEGAPAGTKGISIFVVPKKRIENGEFVDNDVITSAIEKKLGIHASATCALNFGEKDNCIGYLLGQENQGMRIMFDMMNEARLAVGFQGLAQASAAYMHALRYAKERYQGPEISSMKDPTAPKVPIIDHPDVRRMLMWMKSVTEGIRALLYYAGYCEDRIHTAKTEEESAKYQGFLDILIPVCKAWSSDMGFRVTELAIQIYGGYGYCREYPVEQFMRDAKIASIYEGTNGIQALDLVGRKLGYHQGALFNGIVKETGDLIKTAEKNYRLKDIVEPFDAARRQLIEVTRYFGLKSITEDFMTPILYATPYLELFGDVAVGFMLLWQAVIADRRLEELYSDAKADTSEKKAEPLQGQQKCCFLSRQDSFSAVLRQYDPVSGQRKSPGDHERRTFSNRPPGRIVRSILILIGVSNMKARKVVLVDAVRTAFGKAGEKGIFWNTRADDMVVKVIRELLRRNPLVKPEMIEENAWGVFCQEKDQGLTLGRTSVILAGLPETTAGFLDRPHVCGRNERHHCGSG